MEKLTFRQYQTLNKMEINKEYCSYELNESLNTLSSLEKKGYLKSKNKAGSFSSPRTGIMFKRIK